MAGNQSAHPDIVCPYNAERFGNVREVTSCIISVSSCKPGFGVDQLRDNLLDTYWQSDGQLPHLINIQFPQKTTISHVYIFSDYKLDESYTPGKISIRHGTHFNDLNEIEVVTLCEPSGWTVIPIKTIRDKPVRTFMLQIAIISNHQNGRDTHMRQIKIHSPVEQPKNQALDYVNEYSTVEFQQFATIR